MNGITPLTRKVNYYETDAMGIVHHSNYIRWFEEARMDFMDKIGFSYKRVSNSGIDIAVLEVLCRYKHIVTFGETLNIYLRIIELTPVKMRIAYEIINLKDDNICTSGQSLHCFMNKIHRIVRLDRTLPELYEVFKSVKT